MKGREEEKEFLKHFLFYGPSNRFINPNIIYKLDLKMKTTCKFTDETDLIHHAMKKNHLICGDLF